MAVPLVEVVVAGGASFCDALWWAATTVTTVGYGDRYPTSGTGRLVAGLLMVGGIALLGIVTAGIASWLLDRIREEEQESEAITRADIAALSAQIADLSQQVQRLSAAPGTSCPPELDLAQVDGQISAAAGGAQPAGANRVR